MWIVGEPFKGNLQLFRVINVVDIAHGKARPISSLRSIMADTLKVDSHGKGMDHGLLDNLSRLLTHGLVAFSVVVGTMAQRLIIANEAHQFPDRSQYAAV